MHVCGGGAGEGGVGAWAGEEDGHTRTCRGERKGWVGGWGWRGVALGPREEVDFRLLSRVSGVEQWGLYVWCRILGYLTRFSRFV